MNPAEQRSFIQKLIEQPYDEGTLRSVHESLGRDPLAYANLLVAAAESTSEHVAASHWLTEAARVKLHSLRDERGSARLLETALERDPLNLRAAEQLVEVYRSHREDEEIEGMVRSRAEVLRRNYSTATLEPPRAALAFEQLSGVYEALGDAGAAISALRTALELERTQARRTAPSPPPDAPRDSWLRPTGPARDSHAAAPAPESRWTDNPEREQRDTFPSPIPLPLVKESAKPLATEPSPPRGTSVPPKVPLLSVVEAIHGLSGLDDVVDGAALVLKTALEAVPSAAGFVHVCDIATRDFVVVASSGAQNAEIIGTRTNEADPVLVRALGEGQAVTIDASNKTALAGARFRVLSPGRTVLCAPAQFDGRHLGAIELVDPSRSLTFADADRHAMTYLGERFAEFLADRSIAF